MFYGSRIGLGGYGGYGGFGGYGRGYLAAGIGYPYYGGRAYPCWGFGYGYGVYGYPYI